MKINSFKYFIFIIFIISTLIIYLSVIGVETDKFNNQIKKKFNESNKNLDLGLKKVKLTLDIFNFKVNIKTIGTEIYFLNKSLQLEYIKSQISLSSIFKNKLVSSNIEIETNSILLKDLIKFARVMNNNPKLFILEKIIKNGFVKTNLKINFDKNGKIKNNYKIKGTLKDGSLRPYNKNNFKDINFKFDIEDNNFFLQEIKFSTEKINFFSNSIKISKKQNKYLFNGMIENQNSVLTEKFLNLINLKFKLFQFKNSEFDSKNNFSFEIDNTFKFKNIILKSDININRIEYKSDNFINNYFPDIEKIILIKDHKINLNYNNNKLALKGEGKIKIEKKFDKITYFISKDKDDLNFKSNLFVSNINLKGQEFLKSFFPLINNKVKLKNHQLNIIYKNKSLSLMGEGKIKIDNSFDDINFNISKKEKEFKFDVDLNLNKTNFKINNLNFKKNDKFITKLKLKGIISKRKNLKLDYINILENNNKIEISNILLDDKKLFIKFDKADFNYTDNHKKKNKFIVNRIENNKYEIEGQNLNANFLIDDIIKNNESSRNNIYFNNLSLSLKLDKVYIDKIYFVQNLYGDLIIKDNKVKHANILANFNNKEKIKLTIKSGFDGNEITTLNSTWAKPLVNRYKFIKGFESGHLDFYSSKKNGVSNSVLIIDNFKVKEVPALAKLLSLASLQGIADLLTGEGIRFTDFEMKFSNQKKIMTIEELYAIGPSISILMEGYVQSKELISLRGTLVPATTINRTIASIPLIGDLLIGKKVGEGVFGVSFKIKGPPGDPETSVNPIKTLTPRFITRTLEKIKKN